MGKKTFGEHSSLSGARKTARIPKKQGQKEGRAWPEKKEKKEPKKKNEGGK